VELSLHAIDKLQTSGIEGERFQGWQTALQGGEPFLDASSGASGLLIVWEGRPWVVILSNNDLKVVTTYPTDERTVANHRGGGRWNFPNN
jgi:hypothetical protein